MTDDAGATAHGGGVLWQWNETKIGVPVVRMTGYSPFSTTLDGAGPEQLGEQGRTSPG